MVSFANTSTLAVTLVEVTMLINSTSPEDVIEQRSRMAGYLRLLGRLVHNLVARVGEDLADCAAFCRRGLVYKLRSFRSRYDDVGPGGGQDFQLLPEQLASLVESVKNKPWFCELDRKAAQDLVHSGGPGCFVVRPSASTLSLTLTLWFHHRAYNILIRQREDGLLALGSKKNQEMTFRSVEEMVRHYETQPLILYSGGELTGRTRLRAPPPGLVKGRTSTSGSSDGLRRSSDSSEQSRRSSSACLRASGNCEVPFSSTAKRTEISIPHSSGNFEVPFNSTVKRKETSTSHSSGNFDVPFRSTVTIKETSTSHSSGNFEVPFSSTVTRKEISSSHASGNCEVPFNSTTFKRTEHSSDIDSKIQGHLSEENIEGKVIPDVPERVNEKLQSTFPKSNALRCQKYSVPGTAIPSLSLSAAIDPNVDSTCL